MSLLRLYLHGIRLGVAVRATDRLDFLASLLVMLGIELLPSLVVVLLYGNGLAFPGWTIHEALLIQGVFLVARGIAYPFFGGMVWNTTEMVREGTFELLLLQPRHPLVLCVVRAFDAEDLGKLVGGAVLSAWCLSHLPDLSFLQVVAFLGLFATSLLVFAASLVSMATLLIVWVGNFRVYEIFDTLASLGQYPPTVLPAKVRAAALAPVPVLGLAVLPASALLGRSIEGWPWVLGSAIAGLALSLVAWNFMVRRLSGAGG